MDIKDYKTPANLKEYRLGGVKGYSLHAFGSKTRSGAVYERIELRFESEAFGFTRDVSKGLSRLSCTLLTKTTSISPSSSQKPASTLQWGRCNVVVQLVSDMRSVHILPQAA